MTKDLFTKHFFCISFCLYWQFSLSSSMYSGSWCPYQVEKVVPCRVRNGSEPYYGPNICWKSINGSFSCTKKILHRPKFVTTYKKMFETKYKCCPGLEGSDCQNECFNCSSYQDVVYRMAKLETKLNHLVEGQEDNDLFTAQSFVDEDVIHENFVLPGDPIGDKSLTFIALNTRITSLMSEFRDMESRIRALESEVFRLSSILEGTTRIKPHLSRETIEIDASSFRRGTKYHDHNQNEQVPPNSNSNGSPSPTPIPRAKAQTEKKSTSAAIRHLEDNLERGDIASTLNDDYGEEVLFENSTEQYIDELHKDF